VWASRLSHLSRVLRIRHEDNVKSPLKTVRLIADAMGERLPNEVRIPKGYKGALSWKRKLALALSFGLIGDYRPKSKKPILREDLDFIMGNLDQTQEKDWGYDIERLFQEELAFTQNYNKRGHSNSLEPVTEL
ncbi:MAG: hypothetical protein AAGD22_04700, partial [Verrucomicrobiota bacterium]